MTDEMAKTFRLRPTMSFAQRMNEANNKQKQTTAAMPPQVKEHRLVVLADTSGSMCGAKIANAVSGIQALIDNMDTNSTAVSIMTLREADMLGLTDDKLALAIFTQSLRASGGTPLWASLRHILETEPLTRLIVFSDGEASDMRDQLVAYRYKEIAVPIDSIYIADQLPLDTTNEKWLHDKMYKGAHTLKELSDATDGIFMIFGDATKFGQALRYFLPDSRAFLTDKKNRLLLGSGV